VNDGHTLTLERTFAASAERVFDAFTSEEVMRRWFHAGRDWETPEASVDLRVGGEMRVVMRNPHEDVRYGGGGRYTLVERPRRLAFTWVWDDDHPDVETKVEIEFSEENGETTVHFTHRNLWSEEAAADHEDGWNKVFDNLERELGSAAA
jgi:uncharacterized protein YndB with AHSA1/START domain